MATYVIGDVQGCATTLRALLERIQFSPDRDRLWFAGDLVNRGPNSLDVLRFVRSLGEAAVTVLGNHDLHLLAVAAGARKLKVTNTFVDVLDAPDRDDLLDWLRHRPLLYREGDDLLVHAGLWPAWSPANAAAVAREVESHLRTEGDDGLRALYATPSPGVWSEDARGTVRIRAALDVLTRMRTCGPGGALCLDFTGPPAEAPPDCRPWFDAPGRGTSGQRVFFGHWSTLGLLVRDDVVGLDTGCVWGGSLTAYRREDGAVFAEPARDGSAL